MKKILISIITIISILSCVACTPAKTGMLIYQYNHPNARLERWYNYDEKEYQSKIIHYQFYFDKTPLFKEFNINLKENENIDLIVKLYKESQLIYENSYKAISSDFNEEEQMLPYMYIQDPNQDNDLKEDYRLEMDFNQQKITINFDETQKTVID